jgi:hypothetical protein
MATHRKTEIKLHIFSMEALDGDVWLASHSDFIISGERPQYPMDMGPRASLDMLAASAMI